MEYILYCDESIARGEKYSDFYGGALVKSIHLNEVVDKLNKYKSDNKMKRSEVKWTKVTSQYLEKYVGLMSIFFDLIQCNKIKMRVMFQKNSISDPVKRKFSKQDHDESYFKLYYQFIKHAFGLTYSNKMNEDIFLRIFFDQFPDKVENINKFKDYIYNLQHTTDFKNARLKIRYDDMVEAISHDHVILQCADVVTGAMAFRLNQLHLKKDPQTNRRGKRTIAKHKLYHYINERLDKIRPRFNIGVSTGMDSDPKNKWVHPYRHWLFKPSEVVEKKVLHF